METIIIDIRGEAYRNNYIRIVNDKVIYGNMKVVDIVKSTKPLFPSSLYTLLGIGGIDLADIALEENTFNLLHKILN